MRSSITAFIFSVSIALIVTAYVSHILIFNKSITKIESKLERLQSNLDYLTSIPNIFKKKDNLNRDTIKEGLKELTTEDITIELHDISSTLNPNFMDFTLFKYIPLRSTLQENVTWRTLNDFREKNGFITDVSVYDKFFKEEKNIFSLYSLPNINNASDAILELHYKEYTGNGGKATSFKSQVVNSRKTQRLFDEKKFKTLLQTYDKDIAKTVNIIPSWNVNFVPEVLLRTVLSKDYRGSKIAAYNSKISQILEIRKSRLLKDEDLHNILQLKEGEKSAATYLGSKTTFWKVTITDENNGLLTTFIYGWNIDRYKLISLTSELI